MPSRKKMSRKKRKAMRKRLLLYMCLILVVHSIMRMMTRRTTTWYTTTHQPHLKASEINQTAMEPLSVCERMAPISHEEDMRITQKYNSECARNIGRPENTTLLLLEGTKTFGRTGNNLIEFLHALQYARDYGHVVGIMEGSWPLNMLFFDMWLAVQDYDESSDISEWVVYLEKVFCVRVIRTYADVDKYKGNKQKLLNTMLDRYKGIIRMDTKELFKFHHDYGVSTLEDYVEYQTHIIRTLFRYMRNQQMCSVLDALFGEEKFFATYSVIHSRTLFREGWSEVVGTHC